MKKTARKLDLRYIGNQLIYLKTKLQEAILNEEYVESAELRKSYIKDMGENKETFHKLIGPKIASLRQITNLEKRRRILSVLNSSEYKESTTYREQIGILCHQLRNFKKIELQNCMCYPHGKITI